MKTVARHPKQHLIETKVILLAVKWETWNSQRKENMTDVVTQSHGTNNEVRSDQFESVQIRNARLSNPTTFIRFTLLTSTYNLCARIKFRSIANIHSYRMVTVIFLHFNHSQRYGRMNQEFLGIFCQFSDHSIVRTHLMVERFDQFLSTFHRKRDEGF